MSCTRPELNERLVEILDGEVPEIVEHVASCEQCSHELARMKEAFGVLARDRVEPPSQAVLERARAVADRSPIWVMLGGVAAAALAAVLLGAQPGIARQWGALAAAVLSMGAWLAGVRAASREKNSDPVFWLLTGAATAAALLSQPNVHDGSSVCLWLALAAAAGPFAVAAVGLRSNSGLTMGAAAGVLGLLVIRLHCPVGGLSHALIDHLPVLILFVALGALTTRLRPQKAW